MKSISKERQGEIYIAIEALLWSLFPIIAIFSFSSLSPLFSASLSSLAAALFFIALLSYQGKWSDLKVHSAWLDIFIATMLIAVGYYGLVFIGIQKTSAGNASIMLLMEVFFSMLILGLWKKESLKKNHFFGALLMTLGAFLILFQGSLSIDTGSLIILGATTLPPVGNYFAQKAMEKVGSSFILMVRSLLSGFILLFLAFSFESAPTLLDVNNSLYFILINGFLLFGLSKVFWFEAIHRITITKAISLASVAPAFTLFFAYFLLNEVPTLWQIFGLIPIFMGVWLLTGVKYAEVIAE